MPHFHDSCIAEPLFTGDLKAETKSIVCFPALHVHLGVTNGLCDALEERWPEVVLWYHSMSLTREEYFGHNFEV